MPRKPDISIAGARKPAILLMGPTATGKTELALRLAEIFPVELISVDSALVYRGMDIGTAKPSSRLLARVPHRLVDIRDPGERYSAGEFRRDALAAISEIRSRQHIPLLVGGTLLYFRALTRGLAQMPAPNPEIRARLDQEAGRAGWPALHQRLEALDPKAAARIHPNDAQRIQRALEVHAQTGMSLSEVQAQGSNPGASLGDFLRIGLLPKDRIKLNKIVEKRFNAMMEKGFLNEVRALFERGDLQPEMPAMRAVGYRQLWQHLTGECDLEEACRRAVVATRRLAKRQMTWLRSETLDAVFDPYAPALDTQVSDFLADYLGRRAGSL